MKKIYYLLSLIFIISVLSLFSGCSSSSTTTSDEEEYEGLPSERLINRLEANRRKIKNFEGTGTMSIKTPNFDNSASFKVILEKPDSLFLNVFGPFGIDLAQILVSKDRFSFYDALNNTAYEGDLNENILSGIFKINLGFSQLIDAFTGAVNLSSLLYKTPDKYEVVNDEYVITYIDSLTNNRTKFNIDIRDLGIKRYTVYNPSGEILIEAKYSKFDKIENSVVPYHIELNNAAENQKIIIDYKNMDANQNDISIKHKIPSDANVIEW